MLKLKSPGIEAFYFQELPRILLWIGSVVTGFYLILFLSSGLFGEHYNFRILSPFESEFLLGLFAILIALTIPRNGLMTLAFALPVPIITLFQYSRIEQAVAGLTPKLPIQMAGLALCTLEFLAAIYFVALTVTYYRSNKFAT